MLGYGGSASPAVLKCCICPFVFRCNRRHMFIAGDKIGESQQTIFLKKLFITERRKLVVCDIIHSIQ